MNEPNKTAGQVALQVYREGLEQGSPTSFIMNSIAAAVIAHYEWGRAQGRMPDCIRRTNESDSEYTERKLAVFANEITYLQADVKHWKKNCKHYCDKLDEVGLVIPPHQPTPPPPGETPRMHPSDIHKVKNQEAYVGALQQCIYETERALTAANERVAEAIHDKEVVEIELHLKNARIAEQAAQLAEAERREEVAPKEPDTWQILMKELRETSEELGKAKMRVVELERQIETQ